MLSFSKEEMLGKGIADQPCLAPDTMSVVRESQKKYGESVAYDCPFIKKSGERCVMHLSQASIKDAKGTPVENIMAWIDVTEERKREAEHANAISAFSKVLDETAKGNLSARIDTKGWNEELETIGIAIDTLIESLEYTVNELKNTEKC